MRKLLLLLITFILLIPTIALADEDINQIIEQELSIFDFSQWNYSDEDISIDAKDMISQLTKGNGQISIDSVAGYVKDYILNAVVSVMPIMLVLIACASVSGLATALLPDKNTQLVELVTFISSAVCIAVIIQVICDLVIDATAAITAVNSFTESAVPVLSLIMIAAGRNSTNAVMSPAMAYLSGTVTGIVKTFIIPIVIMCFVLAFAKALSGSDRVSRLFSLIKSALKWICGGLTAIFLGAVTVYGLGAKAQDTLILKTTKYVIDKSVPVAGGFISGTADTILECFNTIKSISGVVLIIIILAIVLRSVFSIVAVIVALNITAAVCEPIANSKILSIMTDIAEAAKYLLGAVAIIDTMLIVTIALCTFILV